METTEPAHTCLLTDGDPRHAFAGSGSPRPWPASRRRSRPGQEEEVVVQIVSRAPHSNTHRQHALAALHASRAAWTRETVEGERRGLRTGLRARLDWRKNIGKVKESSSYSIIHCSSVWNKGMSRILSGGTVSKPVLLEESKNPLRPKGNHSCRARVRVHKLIKLTSHGVLQFFLITALKFSETNTPKHRLQYKREKWKGKRSINGNEPRITTQIFLIYD